MVARVVRGTGRFLVIALPALEFGFAVRSVSGLGFPGSGAEPPAPQRVGRWMQSRGGSVSVTGPG
ncbi:hypothetical protein [Streptomyces sp. NPDC101150]|uniref:hypothetical protein n=1 Tax=Streptomyces sp. NPDC101150 TaxID=3366114 RepID=UPI00381D6CE5